MKHVKRVTLSRFQNFAESRSSEICRDENRWIYENDFTLGHEYTVVFI